MSAPTPDPLISLQNCLIDERITNGLIISSTALFFYDYCLTISQEIRYVWKTKYTFANTLFICARYPALLTALLVLLPPKSSVVMSNVRSCLRVLTILSSELIFALRAWAIWGRRKSILAVFICATIAGFVPSVIITVKDISSSAVDPRLPPEYSFCEVIVSSVGKLWVLPYVLIISYQLRILYFASMLILGALNIGLVVQVSSPQLRQGGTQLQTVFHSIMSARIVFHVVNTTCKDICHAESSLEAVRTQYYLSTQIEMENVVASPPGNQQPADVRISEGNIGSSNGGRLDPMRV